MSPSRIALAAALLVPALALADTVTVVTSFPKELTDAYKKAYEAKHPGDKLEILNKNTAAGIAYVREQPAGSRPEVFWASAPDAFEVLASDKLLQKVDSGNRRHSRQGRQLPDQRSARASTAARRSPATASCGTRATWRPTSCPRRRNGPTSPSRSTSATSRSPVAVALRHHAPHRRDHPAGRRLEEGLGAAAGDLRQLRGDHRALLRRARRRVQRPVRRRPRDRLLRPRGEELRLPGGVRLSDRDRDRARQHRAGRGAKNRRGRQALHPVHALARRASSAARSEESAACRCCRRSTPRRPPAIRIRSAGSIQAKVNFDTDLSESRYYVVVVAVRPDDHVPAQGAARRRPRRSRTPRSASAARRVPQLEEAQQARVHAGGGRRSRSPTRRCWRCSRPTRRTRRRVEAEDAGRGRVEHRKPRPTTPRADRKLANVRAK